MSVLGEAAKAAQGAAQQLMKKAIEVAPDSWMPGGSPDPLIKQQHGHVGRSMSRVDGPVKVKGAARFAAEFSFENLTYAAVAFSTIAKGRIDTLDISAAVAAPGVVLVMTYRNAPRMEPIPLFGTTAKAAGGDNLPVMQDDRIHWNGQPIAVVLAETQEQSDHAKSLIRVTYNAEPAVTAFSAAKARGTEPGKFQGREMKITIGDAEAALAAAPHKVDVVYSHAASQPQCHRATRCNSRLGWPDSSGFTTPPRRSCIPPGRSPKCSASIRDRYM